MEELRLIPCGSLRCIHKHNEDKLTKDYGVLEEKFNVLQLWKENTEKVLTQRGSNDYRDKIILENIQLRDKKEMFSLQNEKLDSELYGTRLELDKSKVLLTSKEKEILEVKSKYELDDEVQALIKQKKDFENNIKKLNLERNRLEKIDSDLKEKVKTLAEEYNQLVEVYNLKYVEHKKLSGDLRNLDSKVKKFTKKKKVPKPKREGSFFKKYILGLPIRKE